MTQEDYVSFNTAKLLKEKGFDEPLKMTYWGNGVLSEWVCAERNCSIHGGYEHYAAPTLQMAMKWLRDAHCLFIHIGVCNKSVYDDTELCYLWYINEIKPGVKHLTDIAYTPTYEQACEDAIMCCLKNLL